MIYTHDISPIMLSLGPINLYWYGAMYVISFLLIENLMKKDTFYLRKSTRKDKKWMQENIILFFDSKQSNAILEEKTSSNFAKKMTIDISKMNFRI